MKKPTVHVTYHAVIRYLERVMGFDIERLRSEIASKVSRGTELGATGVILDGVNYRLADKTVVTIVRNSARDMRTGGKQ